MTQVSVTSLDFNTIREQIKTWMRANPTFTDYDFEASGLSFMLDVMAYNTHYNAVLANFQANEMFLDSAVKRSSVLSHAKALGYNPKGYRAARAVVDITISSLYVGPGNSAPDTFILRRGTSFTTQVDNSFYSFVTTNDYSASKAIDGSYTFTNVELAEGLYNSFAWLVTSDLDGQTYTIPNPRVDSSTIVLNTYPNQSSAVNTSWALSTTIFTESTNIFFSQDIGNELTEIYFGNGVVGAKPEVGNVIRAEYITCNGKSGNGAKVFTVAGTLNHNNNSAIYALDWSIDTVSQAAQGSDPESVDEIKYHASKHFSVQNRAVTAYDYENIIRNNFTNLESIKVWGGEDNIPPQYNSVVICIKPNYTDYLTDMEKNEIRDILKNVSVMGMRPMFVDPEYINIKLDSRVKFNVNKLPANSDLKNIVKSAIQDFSDNNLEAFGAGLTYSKLVKLIDSASTAITGNLTTLTLSKYLTPHIGLLRSYTVSFGNQLTEEDGVISSTSFIVTDSEKEVTLTNFGSSLYLIYYDDLGRLKLVKNVGSIDFKTGSLIIDAINVLFVNGSTIDITARPLYQDVVSSQNNILRINSYDISLTTIAE